MVLSLAAVRGFVNRGVKREPALLLRHLPATKKAVSVMAIIARSSLVDGEVTILLAPCFDDRQLLPFIADLRREGISVIILGFTRRVIIGQSGRRVRPDRSLEDMRNAAAVPYFIVPASPRRDGPHLIDPRLHRLIGRTLAAGGKVFLDRTLLHSLSGALHSANAHSRGKVVAWPIDNAEPAERPFLLAAIKSQPQAAPSF